MRHAARSSRRRSTRARSSSTGTSARRSSGKRNGTKVRGVGVGVSAFFAGSIGFDGLLIIKPDGRLYVQSGIGNLGTESVIDVHRVAAEMLGMPWEKVEVDVGQHVASTCRGPASRAAARRRTR